jgi:peptidoglycan/LPS O-acetylase OafA/YrhL
MNYRREIDGLRAVAVLPVILFHAGVQGFSGGFVGVDVFFVISGFLITGILLEEMRNGTFSLKRFYERRARRILPALLLVLAATSLAAFAILTPPDLREFGGSLVYANAFVSNVFFYKQSGYFDTVAELKPILHTWSLAIEEQYYIFFPLLLLVLFKRGTRVQVLVLAAIALASLVYADILTTRKPEAAFFLLHARAWELLLGALGAILAVRFSGTGRAMGIGGAAPIFQALPLLGLLLIGVSVFLFSEETPFPGYYALVPTLGAWLILLFATQETWAGRMLGSRWLVFVGLLSYSAYLWHQPVLVLMRHALTPHLSSLHITLALGAVAALSYLSWRFVEQPFRRPERTSRKQLLYWIAMFSVPLMLFGHLAKKSDGFEVYYYNNRVSAEERAIYDLFKQHANKEFDIDEVDNGACNFRVEAMDARFEQRFLSCAQKHGKGIVVLGDSHAINVYNALFRNGFDDFFVGVAKAGCRPHKIKEGCPYEDFVGFLRRNKEHVLYVVYHQAGGAYVESDAGGDRSKLFLADTPYHVVHSNVQATVHYLDSLALQTKVIWLGPFVEARVDFKYPRDFRGGLFCQRHISACVFVA